MTNFFNKLKKLCYCPIFGTFSQFLEQKIFVQKMAQSHKTSYGFLAPRQNLEKTNNTLPRKCQGRQKG